MADASVRFAIAGAGLAGLALAEELLLRGATPDDIWVIDSGDPKRSSDNPGATFHPFPGSSIAPDPRKLEAARAAIETIERWQSRWTDAPIREFTMLRPLGSGERSERLRTSRAEPEAYPDWLELRRVAQSELRELKPRLSTWDEAFAYRPAFGIDLGELRSLMIDFLRAEGVEVRTNTPLRALCRESSGWRAELLDDRIRVARPVLAIGRGMGDWFPELAMECRGGELLRTEPKPDEDLECAVHASGHVAPAPGGGLIAGATWWAPAEWEERSDREARRAIASDCDPIVPDLDERSTRVWRGIRSGFGDYQPLVGPIPGYDHLYAMAAFGGTGLLSIPRHARALAGHLLEAPHNLRELSRPDRMGADKWSPSPARFRV